MAIFGSRMESIVSVKPRDTPRTGIRWWMNDGTGSKESTAQVANGNKSTAVLGDALGPAGEADRAKARLPGKAINDLANEAPV